MNMMVLVGAASGVSTGLIVVVILAIVAFFILWKSVFVVPQQQAWIVERLGRYRETLEEWFTA